MKFNLSSGLLSSDEIDEFLSSPLDGKKTRGVYNSMQFTLRLNKDIHLTLMSIKSGIHDARTLKPDQIQAYSTFLHENIHWWQHVGSNFGFISSLKFPVQAHINYPYLNELIKTNKAYKPILKFDELEKNNANVNCILNNWFDIEFATKLAFDPKSINLIQPSKYFISVGHSYHILWSAVLTTLASTIDPNYSFLPKNCDWVDGFQSLESNKELGFYQGSDIYLPSFGTKAIFEGQARFNQMQYLYFASNKTINFEDLKNLGMLNGIYTEAFNYFILMLDEQMPDYPDSYIVGLFLLVCDIAINPTEGFPFDINHFESFIFSNDPGYRFHMLSQAVKKKLPELKNCIKEYSKNEYITISELLSSEICCISPYKGTSLIKKWISENESLQQLLEEESKSIYIGEHQAIRLLLSKFLRFQEDKHNNPQIFCWPGASCTNANSKDIALDDVKVIFDKHTALFIDGIDGDIYPTIFDGKDEASTSESFNQFYAWNVVYKMVSEWIIDTGEFKYDFNWLSGKYSKDEVKKWVCSNFVNGFNIHPDEIKII